MRIALFVMLCWTAAWAAESNIEPQLPADPKVTTALAALGDNSSCLLEGIKVHGDVGPIAKEFGHQKRGPGGRDFSIKMVWIPDRQRAFFCGANHGSPHRLNDALEFDLPSNTWAVLYAADYNDRGAITDYDRQTLQLKDGWLRTKAGGPAHPAHTWWGLTYDPGQKAILWWCAWPSYRLKDKLNAIGANADQLYKGPPLWAFYPEQKKWQPVPTTQPSPKNGLAGSLEYVPDLKGSIWSHPTSGVWLLDASSRSWKSIGKGDERPPIETVVCYDPGRKILIAHRGSVKEGGTGRTWHMAVTGDGLGEWKKVLDKPDLPNGHDARSLFGFDPVGKVGLLYETPTHTLWSYDPDKTAWQKLTPNGPPPPEGRGQLAYHDPARNVFLVIGQQSTWCYRHKKAPAAAGTK